MYITINQQNNVIVFKCPNIIVINPFQKIVCTIVVEYIVIK